MNRRIWIGLASVLALIAIGAYLWLRPAPQLPPSPAPLAVSPPATPAEPAIKHPVSSPPNASPLPPFGRADDFVKERIIELIGAKAVRAFVRTEAFLRRLVATVDNLARSLAPPRMWPVRSTPGHFTVETANGGTVIGAKNAARYASFVALVESVDSERAVALYHLLYPLIQRTYEHLGYPGKYFNDRLVTVIDLLLGTPEPSGPLRVDLPQVEGPLKPTHPWLLYRFSDSDLEHLSSGQKILLRVGLTNEKRLKTKLAEIRKLIVSERPGAAVPGR